MADKYITLNQLKRIVQQIKQSEPIPRYSLTNCSNCGAPVDYSQSTCEYCGSSYEKRSMICSSDYTITLQHPTVE